MTSRALTPEAKSELLGRLMLAWLTVPDLRLGQLIVNAIGRSDGADSHIFYAEDFDLLRAVESFAKRS